MGAGRSDPEVTPGASKACKKCSKARPIEDFSRDSRCKDGRRGVCRYCRNDPHGHGRAAKTISAVKLNRFRKRDPASWMVIVAAKYIQRVSEDPNNRTLHYAAGTVARLIAAARGYIQTAELESALLELEKRIDFMDEVAAGGKSYVSAAHLRVAAPDQPSESVH